MLERSGVVIKPRNEACSHLAVDFYIYEFQYEIKYQGRCGGLRINYVNCSEHIVRGVVIYIYKWRTSFENIGYFFMVFHQAVSSAVHTDEQIISAYFVPRELLLKFSTIFYEMQHLRYPVGTSAIHIFAGLFKSQPQCTV